MNMYLEGALLAVGFMVVVGFLCIALEGHHEC